MIADELRPLLIMLALAVLTSALVLYVEQRKARTPIPDVFKEAFNGDNAGRE